MNYYKRVIVLTFTLLLIVTPVAIARYVPSRNQKPPTDYSRGGTTREGCPQITILAPKTHVGESNSTHPTLAWFIFNAAEKPPTFASEVTLTLYEFNSENRPKQIGQPISLKISPGIMKQSLSGIELTKEKRYLWQVIVPCPNGEVFQTAELSVVELPSSLRKTLSTQADRAKKVELYAESGFWYDALTEALTLAENGKLGTVGANLIQNLAEVEESQAPMSLTDPKCDNSCKTIKQRVRRLKEIAISDR